MGKQWWYLPTPQGRDIVLQELHKAHPGVVRMKLLARSYEWWPSINRDIENKVQLCHQCQVNRKSPDEVKAAFEKSCRLITLIWSPLLPFVYSIVSIRSI